MSKDADIHHAAYHKGYKHGFELGVYKGVSMTSKLNLTEEAVDAAFEAYKGLCSGPHDRVAMLHAVRAAMREMTK